MFDDFNRIFIVNQGIDAITSRVFYFEVANPTFKTIIQIPYDFIKEEQKDSSQASFSWMDYKKITE